MRKADVSSNSDTVPVHRFTSSAQEWFVVIMRLDRTGLAALACIAMLESSMASATTSTVQGANSIGGAGQTAGQDEILVTGSGEGLDAAVDSFVETLLAETSNGRVARWANRICVNIVGGSAENNQYFSDRIAGLASQLGIRILSERRCEPSAYIVFTSEPAKLLEQLNESRPAFFGAITPSQREAFRNSNAPVRWVSHADLRGAQGETPMSFYTYRPEDPFERPPVPAMRTTPSGIVDGSRMDLQAMVVLVDVSKLNGISYRSLSAYLAMVVLGNLRPDHMEIGQPSVLNIFSSDRRSGEVTSSDLTDWDLAYLRSLYQGNWNMTSDRRIRRIQAAMARNLGRNPIQVEATR